MLSGGHSDYHNYLSLSATALQQPPDLGESTNNIDLMRLLEDKDGLLTTLQRDKDYYASQDKKMRRRISQVGKQLDEAHRELIKCNCMLIYLDIDKRLCDEISSNKLKPFEIQKIAGSLGIIPGDTSSNATKPISSRL